MALNLEKQLQFYGAYHHDPVNVGIHITCVPLILMTAFHFGTNSPSLSVPEALTIPYLPLNVGTAAAFTYASLYVLMEPVAGGLLAPLLIGGTAYSNYLTSTYGAVANYWAIGIHVVSWIAQFIGHGVYEGRAPALLDNLVQALFLAPFFVWLEILFFFGYRPELRKRVEQSVEREIAKFKTDKSGKGTTKAVANGASNGSAHKK